MGGRGGASGFPANAPVPAAPQNATDTHDLTELAQYMKSTHGIHVDPKTFANQDFENVKNAAGAIEQIVREFPQAAANFHEMRGEVLKHGTMASASFRGIIRLADYYFQSRNGLMQKYANAEAHGFHPKGSNGDHVATHEAGHILERALIDKYVLSKGSDYWTRVEAGKAWDKCTYATKVISEACKIAKKTPAGKGMKNDALVSSVSGYATRNRSEAMAECVADYIANGQNAKPLSVAVWSVLKKELG